MNKAKPYIRCVLFLTGFFLMICLCDYLFAPSGYIRYILHQVDDKEENYDTIILGASHARSAINPYKIDEALDCNTLNVAIPGETIKDSYYLLKESCKNNDVKRVILDVDYQYWFKDQPIGQFSDQFIYSQMKWSKVKLEYLVDNMSLIDIRNVCSKRSSYAVGFDSAKHNVSMKRSEAYKKYSIDAAEVHDADGPYLGKGFFLRHVSGKNPGGDAYVDLWVGRSRLGLDDNVVNAFGQIKAYCDANNIELICITSPITPSSMKKLELDVAHKTFMNDLFGAWGVKYYDFNMTKMSVLPRQDKDYGDKEGHMGGELANEYSSVLGSLLKDDKQGTLDLHKYMYSSFDEMYKNMDADYKKTTEEVVHYEG